MPFYASIWDPTISNSFHPRTNSAKHQVSLALPIAPQLAYSFDMVFSDATRRLLDDEKKVDAKTYVELLKHRGFELEEELQAIRLRQNAYALPNLLPTEILEKIFMEHATNLEWDWELDDKLRWIEVMQVCRRWREVAINCAPLWTTLVVSHPEFMQLMVARSKSLPLRLSFSTNELQYFKPKKARAICRGLIDVLSHLDRFRVLSLAIGKEKKTTLRELLSKAPESAPVLEHLYLSNAKKGIESSLPPGFLQGGAPALQSLSLERVHIPWDRIPLSTTLTRLMIHNGGVRPPKASFYETLSKLEALQDLNIVKMLPSTHGETVSMPAELSLPLVLCPLKEMNIEDSVEELAQFFDTVRTPAVVETAVTITDRRLQGPAVDLCIKRLRLAVEGAVKRYKDLTQIYIRGFDEDEDSHGTALLSMHFAPALELLMSGWSEPDGFPGIVISFKHYDFPVDAVLTSISTRFDFKAVKHIDMSGCGDLPAPLFLEMFSSLQEVERLTICDTPITELLEEMNMDPALQENLNNDNPTPYFPSLSSIKLRYIDFQEDEEVATEETIDLLVSFLNRRPKAHFIKQLYLEGCLSFEAEDFDRLRDRLDSAIDIVWDDGESESEDMEINVDHLGVPDIEYD